MSDKCGNGGTFIANKISGVFRPIIVAGGAAGTWYDIVKPKYISMSNGRSDQFGGNSNLCKNINKVIGSSGADTREYHYSGGAGFYEEASIINRLLPNLIRNALKIYQSPLKMNKQEEYILKEIIILVVLEVEECFTMVVVGDTREVTLVVVAVHLIAIKMDQIQLETKVLDFVRFD